MVDNPAKQVLFDAEKLASDDGDFVRLHHLVKALLNGRGISNTILRSFGMNAHNIPPSSTMETRHFFKPWKIGDNEMNVTNYSPDVVAVWYHAKCLQSETRIDDATEFFLLGILETRTEYAKELMRTFNFTMKQVYRRIEHLQAVGLWTGFEPESHARRLLSLANAEVRDGETEEALRLAALAMAEIRQAKHLSDHRLLLARAQTVKQAAGFYKHIAELPQACAYARRAAVYKKFADVLSKAHLQREEDNWNAKKLGFHL